MLRSIHAILLLSLVVFLTYVSSVQANTQLGYGLTPCSKYNLLRQQSPAIGEVFNGWVLGYLSGVNFLLYTSKGVDLLADISSRQITDFIQAFCNNNPLRTVTEGANQYWFSLADRR